MDKPEQEAKNYVNKHNFDEKIIDTCKACYYDGYSDGESNGINKIKEKSILPSTDYSIETLEIELSKVKETIRNIHRMQDEMFQNHPGLDSYEKKKSDLENAIKLLK